MKHVKRVLGCLLLVIVPILALVQVVDAQRFTSAVEEGKTVHSSVYGASKQVNIKGEIFGDVFCAGQTVHIDAKVHGDIICAGQDITIAGRVDGDIRVAGHTVSMRAAVGSNVSVAAADFSLDASARVGQDLTAMGEKVNIKGTVGRDVVASGATLVFNGPVGRNIAVQSDRVTLKQEAQVKGNLTYTGTREPALQQGAKVVGSTKEQAAKERDSKIFNPVLYILILVSLVIVSMILVYLFPTFMQRTSGQLKANPWKSLLTGLVVSVSVPAISFLLAVTVVGIPLIVVLLLGLAFAILLSGPIVGYYIGRLLLSGNKPPVLIAAVGSLIVVTAYFLPLIGFACMLLAGWLGLGALIIEMRRHSRLAPETGTSSSAKSKK